MEDRSGVENQGNSGKSLVWFTVTNFCGQAVPLLVGVVAIPLLIENLAMDRFGLLTLIWAAIGYFTLFDLGLGRATVKLVAEKLGQNDEDDIPSIVWTTLSLMVGMSLIGTVVLLAATPKLVTDVFKIPDRLNAEGIEAFYTLAAALSVVTLTAGLRGVLEAKQKFTVVNTIQALTGSLSFLGPLVVSYWTESIFLIAVALFVVRLASLLAHLSFVLLEFPNLRVAPKFDRAMLRRLFRFATWMTVSNVISPVLVYFDRFILGSLVPVAQVAFYTTPYEMVNRLQVIPSAIVRTLFPAFASMGVGSPRVVLLFERAVKTLFFLLFPIVIMLVYFSREILLLWLGLEFSQESTFVMQILTLGILINALAWVPFTLIQSAERPDLAAKVHLLELPFYLPIVWLMISRFGVQGAALAWVGRVTVDMFLMFLIVSHLIPTMKTTVIRKLLPLLAFIVILLPALFDQRLMWKSICVAVSLVLYMSLFWSLILSMEDRLFILKLLRLDFELRPRHRLQAARSATCPGICAVVVTYDPSENLRRNIQSYASQVDKVIVIDNGSYSRELDLFQDAGVDNLEVIRNGANLGVAAAINIGVKHAYEIGYDWVMTFDQDSFASPGFVSAMLATYEALPESEKRQVALLSPSYCDEKSGMRFTSALSDQRSWSYIRSAMTSGSLIKVAAFQKVGLYDETLFIDYVDHEFCLRLRAHGLCIAEVSGAVLVHNLGEMQWHQMIWVRFSATHHSSLRRYYNARNRILMYKRYWLIDPVWVINDHYTFAKDLLKILLVESDKGEKFRSVVRGIKHAIVGRIGPLID